MSRNTIRRSLSLFGLVTVLLLSIGAAAATSAFAADGDSATSAVSLNPSFNSSYTASLEGSPTGYFYFLKAELWPGQTFNADVLPGANVLNLRVVLYPMAGANSDYVGFGPTSPTLTKLSFMAPVHGIYQLYVATSGTNDAKDGTFTVLPSVVSPVKFNFKWVAVPSSVKHRKAFWLSVTSTPAYNGLTDPTTKFYVERKGSGGKFKPYTTFSAKITKKRSAYTQFSGNGKLSKKGTYRVHLKLRDAAHGGVYSTWKTFKVK